MLLIACGFIGGVLVEKGQNSRQLLRRRRRAGLASRFAALRAGRRAAGTAARAGGAGLPRCSAVDRAAATVAPTAGRCHLDGTLYVTTPKATPSRSRLGGHDVTKTVKSDVKGIHPGETVTITGAAKPPAPLSAESIGKRERRCGGGLRRAVRWRRQRRGGAGGKSLGGGGGPALFGREAEPARA